MKIVAMYVIGVVVAVVIGLAASAAADDGQSDCVASGDTFNTIVCPD